jgi:hypothetical protein
MSTIDEAKANALRNLEEKTGRSIADWIVTVKASGLAKHGQIVAHLKADHGLTHGYANMVALNALAADEPTQDDDDLVASQYGGAKAAMRPLYESIVAAVKAFGDDVEVAPKKAYVSLRRRKQFAILQPATAKRLDIGINVPGTQASDRLEPSGSFNAMLSHRVRVASAANIDAELLGWLRAAYDAA